MRLFKYLLFLIVFGSIQRCLAQKSIALCDSSLFKLENGALIYKTSFRGLSVVNDNIVWASGSNGTVAKSEDGGKTFYFNRLKGYETCDFRDIEAFDANHAIILSTRAPAYILQTNNGGKTWNEVYKNEDTAVFLDAMDFWNEQKGVLVGDPIDGHFFMLYTLDGGNTWKNIAKEYTPIAEEGEAVFAASGTSLRCWGKTEFGFVTGGAKANMHTFSSFFKIGQVKPIDIQQGNSAKVAFSFTRLGRNTFIVGGDYAKDTVTYKNFDELGVNFYYEDNGTRPTGYLSCVAQIKPLELLACGTKGVDLFSIKDKRWTNLSAYSFNTVAKAKKGNAVFLVGSKGKIAKLTR